MFPCYAAEHAIIRLDRYLYRLHDRRNNSRNLGRRYALLFGRVAQCRRWLCGVVARVSSVKLIAIPLNQLLSRTVGWQRRDCAVPTLTTQMSRFAMVGTALEERLCPPYKSGTVISTSVRV